MEQESLTSRLVLRYEKKRPLLIRHGRPDTFDRTDCTKMCFNYELCFSINYLNDESYET